MTPSQEPDGKQKKIPYHFGEKLRAAREHKGYTLKIVAQKAGVSESLVSQIERNHVSPAIDTLLTLADVLDVNLEYLFEEYRKDRPVQITRKDERPTITEEDTIFEELGSPVSTDKENSFESYILRIPSGSQTHRGSYGHIGREFGFINKGKAKLIYNSKEYILEAGDSVSFSATVPHVVVNAGDEEVEAIWFVTPAQRFVER